MSEFNRWTIKHLPRGDTLVEVMLAVGIFGIVAIGAITLMNKGIATSQATLETTMARQEIDAQSESLRYIHGAYIAETNGLSTSYSTLWENITDTSHIYTTQSVVAEISDFFTKETSRGQSCADLYDKRPSKSFIINSRNLTLKDETLEGDVIIEDDRIQLASTYPRLVYSKEQTMSDKTVDESGMENLLPTETLFSAEGIWITGIQSEAGGNDDSGEFQPDFYDFYVQTCWDSAGSGEATTLSSIIRLFNPNRIVKEGQTEFRGFTLIYDSHGGSGAPPRQQVRDITTTYYDFRVSDIEPEYDDAHIFLGWSTSKTSANPEYYGGNTIHVTKRNTILYAVWKQRYRHSLKYASSCPNTTNMPSDVYSDWTESTSYTFDIEDRAPVCTGYQFRGWSASSSALNPSYQPGGRITVTADVTLHALWQKTNVFTLNFDGNGNNVSELPSTQVSPERTESYYRFIIPNITPRRTNYVFRGWSRRPDGSPEFMPGGTIDVGTAETTLYAIWRRAYSFTLTYDANGGTGAPDPVTFGPTPDSSHVFTVSSAVPERANYTFLGWSVSRTATTASYRGGNTINAVTNITLYAVWTRYYRYDLVYDGNGGTSVPSSQTSGLIQSPNYTFTLSTNTPRYSGFEFIGWALDREATEPQFTPGGSITLTNEGTTTIFAVWRPRFKFTLYYNANGGSNAPDTQDSGYVSTFSHTFTISDDIPTRSNYEFLGWSVSTSADVPSYQPGGNITVSGNTTLYAVWRRIYNYSLIYNANGGSNAPPAQSYTGPNSGSTFTVTDVIPTHETKEFVGWSTSSTAGSANYVSGDRITISADTTLYAVWRSKSMQDFYCGALNKNETTTLTDTRDSNRYQVKRLNDGNCWMIENLRFAGEGNGLTDGTITLDPSTSDVDYSRTIDFYDTDNWNICGGTNSNKNHACVHKSNNDVYYNYASATALTATGNNFPSSVNESICPSGWSLPTKSQFRSILSFVRQFEPASSSSVGMYEGSNYSYSNGARYWWSSTIANPRSQLPYSGVYDNVSLNVYGNVLITESIFIRCVKTP